MNENWLECFDKHNVQFVVLSQGQDEELVKILHRRPEWLVDFEGDGTVIFARSAQDRKASVTHHHSMEV